jgi:plastocyanin
MKKDLFILLALIGLSIGCSVFLYQCKKSSDTTPNSSSGSNPGTNEVWMQNMAFNPGSLTVVVNTTVKWTNKDGVAHTVTSATGAFDSGSIAGGGVYSHQFTTAGTYPYKCTFHSGMTGTVIVQ